MKEQEFKELMVAIRRNTKPSKCIDNFENLILEINNPEITDIFVSEMSGFMSKLFELFHEVDKLNSLKLKARILTREFIKPKSYFNESKRMANKLMEVQAAREYLEKTKSDNTKDADRNTINFISDVHASRTIEICNIFWPDIVKSVNFKEIARKTMLLYHYIPAIYKALIQTKRRELGLDKNSHKF